MAVKEVTGRIYRCSLCGKEERWDDNWSWYGSNLHLDECPNDIPLACSAGCKRKLKKNIDEGVFILPELSVRGYNCIMKTQKQGY